jgi:hypothetical protein
MKMWLQRFVLWLGLVAFFLAGSLLLFPGEASGFRRDLIAAIAVAIVLIVLPIKGKGRK